MMALVDLDLFYSKVKFGHLGVCIGKMQKVDFSKTIVAYDIKIDIYNQLNDFYKYQRSMQFIGLFPGCSDSVSSSPVKLLG